MVPPATEEDMMVLPKLRIEGIPSDPAVCSPLARYLDKKDDLNADPGRPGERYRNIQWFRALYAYQIGASQILDRMNKYYKDHGIGFEVKVADAGRYALNDYILINNQQSSLYESYKDPYFNISGNGNKLEDARGLVMEQYKDHGIGFEVKSADAGRYAGNDYILINNQQSSLYNESYKVALERTVVLPTLTNERVGTLAAINSRPTGGAPMTGIHLVLDSGASSHVVGDKRCLKGYQPLANPRMGRLPDNSLVSIVGVGTIQTEDFSITNVSHVEGLAMNLISVSQLDKNYGMGSWFLRGQCGVMLPDGTTAGEGTLENGVYVLSKLHVPAGPVMEA